MMTIEQMEEKERKEDKKKNKNGWFLTCGICHLSIDTEEQFAEFIHYNKHHDINTSAFYHIDCFKDKINVSKKASKELDNARNIINKAAQKLGLMD
jgi:hypothetical protein